MKVELEKYSGLRVCVAVSGGKDSMALLHYIYSHGVEFGIELCALNCDHGIRGAASEADSAFVKNYCEKLNIPLLCFKNGNEAYTRSESAARGWRAMCYVSATAPKTLPDGTPWKGADAVATAHHLNDNAETVLFNVARGSGLAGAEGITDTRVDGIVCNFDGGNDYGKLNIIHPLIAASREEIDQYIAENGIPYVTDESNFTDDYTRNKIRHNVIPALEDAVRGACRSIYRFSRIVSETEEYFENLIQKNGVISSIYGGQFIKNTWERAVFSRAALKVFLKFGLKDYTREHIERLYQMQFGGSGKKFEFLGLIAYKEEGGIAVCPKIPPESEDAWVPFSSVAAKNGTFFYNNQPMIIDVEQKIEGDISRGLSGFGEKAEELKILKFDADKIPEGAVVRFKRGGDKFTKFGGGTKSFGDFLTDKKIPLRLRGVIPLVACGNEVLIAGGVEISDGVKVTAQTKSIYGIVCRDYTKI